VELSLRFGQPDVVVLTEVMSNKADEEVGNLRDLYPYQTPRLGNDCDDLEFDSLVGCTGLRLNGGTVGRNVEKMGLSIVVSAYAYGDGIVGPGESLGSPWPPLAIRPLFLGRSQSPVLHTLQSVTGPTGCLYLSLEIVLRLLTVFKTCIDLTLVSKLTNFGPLTQASRS
jgi:hypothetical protein